MPTKRPFLSLSGRAYPLVAIAIFGAANAVTRRLTDLGAKNLMDGRNPISFCNVLFVGNICALALLSIIYRRQLRTAVLRPITARQWWTLTVNASLSAAVVPMLIFPALSITVMNNVVLIGQIDTSIALWMLVYSAVIVVGGQLAWFNGLRQRSASEISLATAFESLAGVLAAFLILGEVPAIAHYVGGAVILAGIALNQIGIQKLSQTQPSTQPTPAEISDQILYKGI